MVAKLAHRGPDGHGVQPLDHATLGHTRLAILDLAGGHQPMQYEDTWIAFNGEIYNYRELQTTLQGRGHALRTRSDTETILHLYEDHDLTLFDHLRGMYAFALWDSRRERLLLAVDHIGIKPLYVAQVGNVLIFASEVKALFAYGDDVPRILNLPALETYLTYGFMVGDETPFEGIRRLDPGTALVVEKGAVRTIQHWAMTYPEQPMSEAEAVERVRATLREAVSIHLRSDVPLGLFLSGGVDSATLLALMAGELSGTIETFSVGYSDGDHPDDELSAARASAACFSGTHHELTLTAADWWGHVERYVYAHDEPNANPSAVSLLALSELTGRHVKVVLNGIGSDELFAGYALYRDLPRALRQAATIRRLLPALLRNAARGAIRSAEGLYPFLRQGRFVGAVPNLFPPAYHRLEPDEVHHLWRTMAFDGTVFTDGLRRSLLCLPEGGRAFSVFQALLARAPQTMAENLIHWLKMYLWLPGNGLLSADKVSMAHSLEGRVPFFDRILMELVGTIPAAIRLKGNKFLLRAAMDETLPAPIRDRAKKPFGTPIRAWFEGALRERLREVLYDPAARQRPYLDGVVYRRLIDGHFAGRTSQTELIWRLVTLELWVRGFGV